MKKVATVFDTVLTFIALFLLGSVVAGYFLRSAAAVLTTALTFTLAVLFFTGRLSLRRKRRKESKRRLNDLCNKFLFSPPAYAFDHVWRAVEKKCTPQRKNGLIMGGATAFHVCLTPDKVSASLLAERYASAVQAGAKRLVFLSAFGAQDDVLDTAKRLCSPTVEIWDWEKVYDFLLRLGCPPTETLPLPAAPKQKIRFFDAALKRENARRYLFTAIITLLFARFMPFAVFYVAVAAVSLSLAILCRIDITQRAKNKKRS